MRRKITKLAIFIVALTMALGTLAIMTGCDASTWQQDFNALEAQVTVLEQNGNATAEQIAGVQEQLNTLKSRANSNGQRGQVYNLQIRIITLNGGNVVEQNIIDAFDLTDPKEVWDGNLDDIQFYPLTPGWFDLAIGIEFRLVRDGEEYPLIEAHHLGLNNIRHFIFIQFQPSHWGNLPFRQFATLYLTESTPEIVTATIRHLETLCFVRSVGLGNTLYTT